MGKFFIPKILILLLIFLIVFGLLMELTGWVVFGSICFITLLFFTRKIKIPLTDTRRSEDTELIISPCFGEIENIRETEDFFEIIIYLPIASSWHLYLPTSVIMHLIKNPNIKEEKSFKTIVNLESMYKHPIDLYFLYKYKIFRPVFWMKPGDNGRGAACFGYYPFGGLMILKLPKNSEILVTKHEKVIPAKSVIAIISNGVIC